MDSVAYKSTVVAMRILEKLIKAKIHVHGLEHIQDRPTLFVVNHFTRTETFILPYVMHKYADTFVCSLTDAKLFTGKFGEYLGKLGAVSVDNEKRDEMIVRDLMTGQRNWVIYPEGVMVKNKSIWEKGKYVVKYPERIGPPHTGAATLALLSEMYRQEYLMAKRKNDQEAICCFDEQIGVICPDNVATQGVVVVPVNITYYPIRPGQNIIKNTIKKFFKSLPERLDEELEIEGNLLMKDTDMHITFNPPIFVEHYLKKYFFLRNFLPRLVRPSERLNFIVSAERSRLTTDFMQKIYESVVINFDHLFCTAIDVVHHWNVDQRKFLEQIYLAAQKIQKSGKHFVHESVSEKLVDILSDEPCDFLTSIENLAKDCSLIHKSYGRYEIHQLNLKVSHVFHKVRLTNMVRVIANEMKPLKHAVDIVKKEVNRYSRRHAERMIRYLCEEDERFYRKEYERTYDANVSKPYEIGRPFFLRSEENRTGVLLSHGYMASPAEVDALALYLHKQGYNVYVTRLKGHGTVSSELAKVSAEDWYRSYNRGYAVLKQCCDKIVVGGFSLGGTLALRKASQSSPHIAGVFSINAPLKLRDIKAGLVSTVTFYNKLLDRFHLDKGKLDYVENVSENPAVNYNRNYLKGIYQLKRAMEHCQKELPKLQVPALVLQATHDPVVSPKSGRLIYDMIASVDKELKHLDFDRHNILRLSGAEDVFREVDGFLKKVL